MRMIGMQVIWKDFSKSCFFVSIHCSLISLTIYSNFNINQGVRNPSDEYGPVNQLLIK